MAVDAKQLADELEHRRFSATYVLDAFSGRETTYAAWRVELERIDNILQNRWAVAWPDGHASFGDPHVPNIPAIAVKDRSRLVAAGNPSIVCRPESISEPAKKAAERRERVLGGLWEMNHIRRTIGQFGADLMVAGLAAVKVLPDLGLPVAERFPIYSRIDPRHCYPGPMFTQGPEPKDMLVSYRRSWREIAKEYDCEADLVSMLGRGMKEGAHIDFIAYYDDKIMCALARYKRDYQQKAAHLWLVEPMEHKVINAAGRPCSPVAMTALPNPLALYEGDFTAILGALRTWNRRAAMEEDAAIDRTYPSFAHYDIANPQDRGPDADLEMETERARAEYVVPPGTPFSDSQSLKQTMEGVRAGALLPPARTGDPNESIISAAGISAANSQMADHVRSIQRDCIAPLLEQANAIALCVDETHCDATKSIHGYARGRAYREEYTPSKVIDGNYRNSVMYGMGAGLDEVNASILVLQNKGAGMLSTQHAMERNPFVEDPLQEMALIDIEQLKEALKAGILSQAMQGTLPAQTVAAIMADREKMSLEKAVAKNLLAAPMAEPEAATPPAQAAGVAGAEQPTGFQGKPSLDQLMPAGARG